MALIRSEAREPSASGQGAGNSLGQRNRLSASAKQDNDGPPKAELELAWNATSEAEALAEAVRAALATPRKHPHIGRWFSGSERRSRALTTARRLAAQTRFGG